jgi:hypothetical protein
MSAMTTAVVSGGTGGPRLADLELGGAPSRERRVQEASSCSPPASEGGRR